MTLEKQLVDDVTKILGPNGFVTKNVQGMVHHPDQFDFALRTVRGFCAFDKEEGKASLNLLQAGTGTGKTIAYLVPLMLYSARTGERVAVSTYTRQLQHQVAEEDGLFVQEWVRIATGKTVSIGRRVGLANYVSVSGCERLLGILEKESNEVFDDAIALLDELIDWIEGKDNQAGVLDDFMEQKDLAVLPFGINKTMISLDRSVSPADEMACYEIEVTRSKNADVLVVNHALLVMNAYRFASVLDDWDVRPMSVLVCDEADRLVDAAESMLSADLPLHKLKHVVSDYAAVLNKSDIAVKVNEFYDYVMDLKPPSLNLVALSNEDMLFALADSARKSLMSVERDVMSMLNNVDTLNDSAKTAKLLEFVDVVNDLNEFCGATKSSEQSAFVSWSPIREFPSLRLCQPNPGRILGRMWALRAWDNVDSRPFTIDKLEKRSYLKAALFTSATMATPGRIFEKVFDDFASSIGINRHKSLTDGKAVHNVQTHLFNIYEPKKFGKMHFVLADPTAASPSQKDYIDGDISYTTDPDWLDYCATVIRTAQAKGGRCLVLALSFRDCGELGKRLRQLDHLIVHKQGDQVGNVLRDYVNDDKAILISPSVWEGVNLPGMVNNLVVTRIPFAPSESTTIAFDRAHLLSKGFSEKKISDIGFAKMMNSVRRKLSQGLGRGIRRDSDDVTVWIADPRFPLPDHLKDCLDPVLMGGSHRTFPNMHTVIPKRFIETQYKQARFCLKDGTVYSPISFGD